MKKNLLSLLLLSLFALSSAFGQSRKITGTITGADDGQALPGVTVRVPNGVGTQTNAQGQFSVDVPAGTKSLIITYVGYVGQTITVGSSSVMNVQLIADNKALSEVVSCQVQIVG